MNPTDPEIDNPEIGTPEIDTPINLDEGDFPGTPVEKPGKKWRFNNVYLFLTYRTHINKEAFQAWLKVKIGRIPRECHIAHESGSRVVPYLHSHVWIDFGTAYDCKNCRWFDYEGIHPNWRIGHKKGRDAVLAYMSKEDGEVREATQNEVPFHRAVWACASIEAAYDLFVKKPADVKEIKFAWDQRPRPRPAIADMECWPWQQVVCNEVSREPGQFERKLNWIWEDTGNTGKSCIGRHLIAKHPDKYLYFPSVGKASDVMQGLITAYNRGWMGYGVFIDLSRQFEMKEHLYGCLEQILNGVAFSGKYTADIVQFDVCPHLYVFANWPPATHDQRGRWTMSEDRWVIRRIVRTPDGALELTTDNTRRVPAVNPEGIHTATGVAPGYMFAAPASQTAPN